MPMQVVVPSVSRAAVLQRRAGTILVEPSGAGWDKPTVELGASSAIPCTVVGAGGADWPVMGGGGVALVLGGAHRHRASRLAERLLRSPAARLPGREQIRQEGSQRVGQG